MSGANLPPDGPDDDTTLDATVFVELPPPVNDTIPPQSGVPDFGELSWHTRRLMAIPAGTAVATIQAAIRDLLDRVAYLDAVATACGRALDDQAHQEHGR